MNITLHAFNRNEDTSYQDIPINLSITDDIRLSIEDEGGECLGEFHIQLLDDSTLGLSLDTNGVSKETQQ